MNEDDEEVFKEEIIYNNYLEEYEDFEDTLDAFRGFLAGRESLKPEIESLTRLVEEMKEALEYYDNLNNFTKSYIQAGDSARAHKALSSYQQYKEGKEIMEGK